MRTAAERPGAVGTRIGHWRRLAAAAPAWLPAPTQPRMRLVLAAATAILGTAGMLVLVWMLAVRDPSPESPSARHGEHFVELALPPAAPRSPADPGSAVALGSATASALPVRRVDPLASIRPDPANGLTVPAVTAAAFAAIPLAAPEAALPPAPDPALIEDTEAGPLPRRGADGRVPWRVYARPFAADGERPRVAVIVAGLGLSEIATGETIRRLPGAVTLAFEPTAADVDDWARAARAGGHEILLNLPLQGDDFPFVDEGPDALAPDLSPEKNRDRLHRLLARMTGYVGVLRDDGVLDHGVLDHGGLDLAGPDAAEGDPPGLNGAGPLAVVDDDLGERGLLVVGDRGAGAAGRSARGGSQEGGETPWVRPDLTMTGNDGVAAIRARFAALEALARSRTYAIAVVEPSPLAIAELAAWSGTLAGKDLVLAPVSAVAAAAAGLDP